MKIITSQITIKGNNLETILQLLDRMLLLQLGPHVAGWQLGIMPGKGKSLNTEIIFSAQDMADSRLLAQAH